MTTDGCQPPLLLSPAQSARQLSFKVRSFNPESIRGVLLSSDWPEWSHMPIPVPIFVATEMPCIDWLRPTHPRANHGKGLDNPDRPRLMGAALGIESVL